MSNSLETSVAELRQGLELAETMGDANKLAETYWNLALVHLIFRQPARVLEFAQHALRDAQVAGNKEVQARSLFLIGTGYDSMSAWEQAIAPLEESRSIYDTLAWAVEAAAGAEHRVIRHTELTSIGVQPLWTGAGPVTGIAYRTMQATGLYESAANRNNYGDPREGIRLAHEAMRISQEINDKTALVMSAHELVRGLTELGQYEEALALAENHRSTARGLIDFHRTTFLAALVATYLTVYLPAVDEALAEAVSVSGRMAPDPGHWGQNLRCVALALSGDWPAASDAARAATEDRIHRHSGPFYHWWYAYYETEALLRSGEIDLARSGIRVVSERSSQSRRCQLVMLRMQALLAAFEERSSDAIGYLKDALELAEQIGLPGEQWQIAASLARVHESIGQLAIGQQLRKRAHEVVSELADGLTNPPLRAGYLTAALNIASAPAPLLEARHTVD
jgi:tetratricopeptide (TPR) repeat protein